MERKSARQRAAEGLEENQSQTQRRLAELEEERHSRRADTSHEGREGGGALCMVCKVQVATMSGWPCGHVRACDACLRQASLPFRCAECSGVVTATQPISSTVSYLRPSHVEGRRVGGVGGQGAAGWAHDE
uniref:RING-type domain-containing protein n=1 Tax=Palpitomonas bilix TaxID=652834 RepID=A0A7S3DHB4_9EUKA